MMFRDNKYKLLRILYDKKFEGLQDVQELFKPINISREEASQLALALKEEGLAKWKPVMDAIYAEILPKGVEFIEADGFEASEYQPSDKFTKNEKEFIRNKLDEFGERLYRMEVGQQITYDGLMAELEELKALLTVLGKKDWKQNLKGKLVDAGFGKLTDQVFNLIINTFQDGNLLN